MREGKGTNKSRSVHEKGQKKKKKKKRESIGRFNFLQQMHWNPGARDRRKGHPIKTDVANTEAVHGAIVLMILYVVAHGDVRIGRNNHVHIESRRNRADLALAASKLFLVIKFLHNEGFSPIIGAARSYDPDELALSCLL